MPRLIGKGKVKETFAVQSRVLPDDLYADGAKQFAVGSFSDLKFSRAFSQLIGRQKHGLPTTP